MTYSELKEEIQKAPMTWLPALLIACTRACKEKKVFRDDEALLRIVENSLQYEDPGTPPRS